jgi:branched-chain amino acid transport system substrate-binding protein
MITRRTLLKGAGAAGMMTGVAGMPTPTLAKKEAVKIGYVSPQTGPLAAFAEADKFVVDGFLKATKGAGLSYEVVVKDSQSNPNRAAEVAKGLIVSDQVSLMLVASTPETTNPVATTCEAEGVLCISSVAPWQPWFIGQQGKPDDPKSSNTLITSSGVSRTSSPFTPTCGDRSKRIRRLAASSPTTATATLGATQPLVSPRCLRSWATS